MYTIIINNGPLVGVFSKFVILNRLPVASTNPFIPSTLYGIIFRDIGFYLLLSSHAFLVVKLANERIDNFALRKLYFTESEGANDLYNLKKSNSSYQ